MKVIDEKDMTIRFDFLRPLKPLPEESESVWCIPFEYGANEKGTRISISKAKEIAAELRAEIAEAEKRELFRAFKQEEARAIAAHQSSASAHEEKFALMQQLEKLKKENRRRKKKGIR